MKKRLFAAFLSLVMVVTGILPAFAAPIVPAEAKPQGESLFIPHNHTTGETNKFTFSQQGWVKWEGEHYWTAIGSTPPEEVWYTVDFVGNAIEVHAGKNQPMGFVKYYIDNELMGEYSLYNDFNINSTHIVTFAGLEEGPHTFKAVATGKRDVKSTNIEIDCAEAVVWHQPYALSELRVTAPAEGRLALTEGGRGQIDVAVAPSYTTAGDVSFTSSRPEIAKVNADGSVEALKAGDAVITVSPKNSKSTAAAVTVPVKVAPAVPELGGLVTDIDTQYVQKRYQEVRNAQPKRFDTLTAWKNDKAQSEIVLFTKDCTLNNVRLSASDLKAADGSTIGAENIDLTYIKATKAYNAGYPGYGNRNPPPAVTPTNRDEVSDILYQDATTPMDMGFNMLQPVWVSISVPKDAKAGTYTTTITATADGVAEPLEFTYTLNVKDVVLRDAADFKDYFDIELWQYPYSVAEYYGVTPFSQEHFDILRPHMEMYKEIGGHAITATISEDAWEGQTYSKHKIAYPSMVKWTRENGKMTYDYTDLDKWVEFNKELGLGDKIVLYSVAPWHFSFTYWEDGQLKVESFRGQEGSDWYNRMWGDFLQDLADHMTEKGWFDSAYIGIDERGLTQAALDVIYSVTNKDGQKFKTASAINDFEGHKVVAMQVTDVTVGDNCVNANYINFEKQRAALGLRTTLYTCTQHRPSNFTRSAPVESYWTVVNAGRYSSGMLRWAYDAWVEDPLRDTTHSAFEPGDCFMVYPGEKDASDRMTRSSIRFERIAQGVRDVNKLRQMVELMPSLKAQSDALFNGIQTQAWISNDYLNEGQVARLRTDMERFEAGLNRLTDTFVEAQKNGSDKVTSITIRGKNPLELNVGDVQTLTAALAPADLRDQRVTWTSSASDVVSVDSKGRITARKEGSADIIATSVIDPAKSGSVRVNVVKTVIDLKSRVSYYSLDGNLNDGWGDRPGSGDISYAPGMVGQAVRVTPNNRVRFAKRSPLPDYTDAWTVSYWVKSEQPLKGQVSVMMTHDDLFSFCLKLKDGGSSGFRVGLGDGDVLTMAYDFRPDQWYHVTWSQSRQDGLTMYVNGERIAHTDWSKSGIVYAPIDFIGGRGFTGLMDEVKVYNRVLTDAEVAADMAITGLTVDQLNVTLKEGEKHQIHATLNTSESDKTITYTSADPKVAAVDSKGLVTAVKRGETTITVAHAASGLSKTVKVTVKKDIPLQNTLPLYELPEDYLTDIEKAPGTDRQYLGQPDMVRTSTGRLITAYPVGHGHGPLVMRISDDEGESWTEIKTPASWKQSQETPTLYVLNLPDGRERIMLITACPNWDLKKGGWDTAYSDDNGNTWTELRNWHATFPGTNEKNWSIVGMASLVQLRDEKGQPMQKWMGVYHNYNYVNYKTYLTFDEQGNEQWSAPEPFLTDYRDIESTYQMCEIGMFRSPDGKRIVGLARSQSHNNPATLIYSDDEGKTWSKPMDLPGSLAGERHKATYDPISGRLLITFRQIKYDLNGNGKFDGANDWRCGSWMAWIGTYDDLMDQEPGEFCVTLDTDYAQNRYGGDTGYSGVVVLEDGTFIIDSYGHFDKKFSENHGSDVRTDLCYIRQAKFKLGEIENVFGRIDRSKLDKALEEADKLNSRDYTSDSFAVFADRLAEAKAVDADAASQQLQIDAAEAALNEAVKALKPAQHNTTFPDVKPGDWFYKGVTYSAGKGFMSGLPDGTFGPAVKMTRAQLVQMLYALEGKPVVKNVTDQFSDVKVGDWFADAVTWAVKAGVTGGVGGGKFAPNALITRQEMAVMLYAFKGRPAVEGNLDFTDKAEIADWAAKAVVWAVENGLMSSVSTAQPVFSPKSTATRAEAAIIMMNLDKLGK